MAFAQRLPAEFFAAVQADVRARLAAAGFSAGIFDDPDDVAYLTGFFHFPNERPVAVWLAVGDSGPPVLLVPELEREYAQHQQAAAELVSYPEFPGVRPPFTVLAAQLSAATGPVGYGDTTTTANAEQARYYATVLAAQQVGLAGLRAGRRCCDVNAECLAVIRDAGLAHYLRHRQGHGIGINIHEPPWLEDGDDSELVEAMIVSDEPGLYVPGLGGYRISDSVLVGSGRGEPLTAYPKNLDDVVIAL
jgi:Xaa-Pro aminopeptidase